MIQAYLKSTHLKPVIITPQNCSLLSTDDSIWIDVFAPTKEEEKMLEKALQIDIPTREEMLEIEVSSRLYVESDSIFMTASLLAKSESPEPKTDAITLICTENKFITIRYIEANAMNLFALRMSKIKPIHYQNSYLLIEFLDATIDRLADILERIGASLDCYSQTLFHSTNPSHNMDYKNLLKSMGANGDLTTKVSESLVTFNLVVTFYAQVASSTLDGNMKSKLTLLEKDIIALSNHVLFFSSKVNFLLDATLGMVTIEQNSIIKIFSIAAVMFLPPTLIASIYGMNFKFIPELSYTFGYPLAILSMILSAWIPYKILKKKKWL